MLEQYTTDKLSPLMYMGKAVCSQKCEMQYYLQHHLHIGGKSKPDYLTFGSTFHKAALELGLVYGFPVAEAVLSQRIDLATTLGWKQDQKIIQLFGSLTEQDRNLMLAMLEAFEAKINEARIKSILGVEKTVLYPIQHLSNVFTHWCIKKDFLFEDEEGIWVGDLKTTSGYGASTAKYYHASPQTKTYFYIAQQMMPNLRGTKIFVVTKQKIRCEIETIYLTDADKYEAELFIKEALRGVDAFEERLKNNIPPLRQMSHCLNFLGQECPYIPLCAKAINSERYVKDLLDNWFEESNPDDHLELGE